MTPVRFLGMNFVYAKHQPPYIPLPVQRDDEGKVLSCWSCSWKERLTILLTGRVWLSVLTFKQPLQPVRLSVREK